VFAFVATLQSVMIALGSRNSLRPKTPPSRPMPDCLKPPKGASGSWLSVLISTLPASRLRATRFARSGSEELT